LKVSDFRARPSAAEVLGELRRLAPVAQPRCRVVNTASPNPPENFEVGSVIDDVLRVDAVLGAGLLGLSCLSPRPSSRPTR
jgi:hypothetical protein